MDGRIMSVGNGRAEDIRELYEKQRAEREKEKNEAEEAAKKETVFLPRRDEYIPGDSAPEAAADGKNLPEKAAPEEPGEKEEKWIGNTDEVEREIRELKKKKAELEQKITQAQDDPEKKEKLEKELQQVEQELKLKDTDSYRKQHTKMHKAE